MREMAVLQQLLLHQYIVMHTNVQVSHSSRSADLHLLYAGCYVTYTAHCTSIGCNKHITQAEHNTRSQALQDIQRRLNTTHRTRGELFSMMQQTKYLEEKCMHKKKASLINVKEACRL